MLEGTLTTAGERLALRCEPRRVARVLAGAVAGELAPPDDSSATLAVTIEDGSRPFPVDGYRFVARGVWQDREEVVVRNVCTSGFDLRLALDGAYPRFTYRRRAPFEVTAAAAVLRARARQLTLTTLLAYPAMWCAARFGRAPMHAAGFGLTGMTALVGGTTGVGKSTVLRQEVAAGARPLSDNLCVTDGSSAWPVAEPLRLAGEGGERAPHGRSEHPMRSRLAEVNPDVIILLRRGATAVRPVDAETAARALISHTYMAGELRRFWSFAATLAAAAEVGPSHPPVVAASFALARTAFCVEVSRPAADDRPVSVLLREAGVLARGSVA